MKRFFLLSALLIFFCCSYAQPRPNIIVFLVDDMGWMDTSVPFGDSSTELNRRYRTPNMERLAREGMKFTSAYATPVCTPSRVSMLTGMNAAHHGVTNWTSPTRNNSTDKQDQQFGPASWMINGFSSDSKTPSTVHATPFPLLLRDAGYLTIHVGKGHWGSIGTPGSNPHNLGFTVNIAGHAAGSPQSYLAKENFGNLPGKSTVQAVPDLEEYFGSETFLTDALTLEAIKAMDLPIKTNKPFYLNMAHYAVHDPISADPRFMQKYLDAGLDSIEARYASLVEGMDKSLGDIMDYLASKNATKNTIIIFMSDNGGLSLVPPRGGKAHTHNLPLKSGKGSVYEGGIREPMIVKWPGVIKAGTQSDEYVIIEDFFPTILDMAGIKKSSIMQELDGKSFLPILRGKIVKDTSRTLVWHFPNKWQNPDHPGINYKSAIRQGDWKLIYNMRDGSKELYNLRTDISELNNLASVNQAKVKTLSILLSDKLRKWKAPMPLVKASGRAVLMPDETN